MERFRPGLRVPGPQTIVAAPRIEAVAGRGEGEHADEVGTVGIGFGRCRPGLDTATPLPVAVSISWIVWADAVASNLPSGKKVALHSRR